MTRHRQREAWVEEILTAAADEIAAEGYSRLTMEAVIARTDLSKGGVYRFFKNKHELGLALFARCYVRARDFDIDEAVAWGLSIEETVFRLLFGRFDDTAARDELVWLQLIPETVHRPEFLDSRRRLVEQVKDRYRELVVRLVERDGHAARDGFGPRLEAALAVGHAMIEGLSLQGPLGTPREEQAAIVRRVLSLLLRDALGGGHEEG